MPDPISSHLWTIRKAEAEDRDAVLDVVREAFTGPDHDGNEEVDIVRQTWALGAGVEGLELVADQDGAIIGHVLGARADAEGTDVLAVAPLGVVPNRRGQGVGSALMTELLRRAEGQGWPFALLLGDPGYYGRFGFEPAGPFGFVYGPAGPDSPHFQIRRLSSFQETPGGQVRYCWERDQA